MKITNFILKNSSTICLSLIFSSIFELIVYLIIFDTFKSLKFKNMWLKFLKSHPLLIIHLLFINSVQ